MVERHNGSSDSRSSRRQLLPAPKRVTCGEKSGNFVKMLGISHRVKFGVVGHFVGISPFVPWWVGADVRPLTCVCWRQRVGGGLRNTTLSPSQDAAEVPAHQSRTHLPLSTSSRRPPPTHTLSLSFTCPPHLVHHPPSRRSDPPPPRPRPSGLKTAAPASPTPITPPQHTHLSHPSTRSTHTHACFASTTRTPPPPPPRDPRSNPNQSQP